MKLVGVDQSTNHIIRFMIYFDTSYMIGSQFGDTGSYCESVLSVLKAQSVSCTLLQ